MSWTRRGVVVACAMAAAMPALAEASVDTYPLWEVRRGGATVFLFGDCGSPTDHRGARRASKRLSPKARRSGRKRLTSSLPTSANSSPAGPIATTRCRVG